MSSKNRKFRKKVEDSSSAPDAEDSNETLTIKSLAKASRGKDKKPQKPSLLSFDEEEGGSPVKVKTVVKEKSKPKVRPNLQGLSIREDVKPSSTQQSGAGEI